MAIASRSSRASRLRPVGPFRPSRPPLFTESGLWAYEAALAKAGFPVVAGADEAGRGACAGPLVVAACVLSPSSRRVLEGLNDSKLLTPETRERYYEIIVRRAVGYSVVAIPPAEIDAWGLHVANLAGMRRALGQIDAPVSYVLTDGFPVPGLGVPGPAVWKGDAVAACIAAASVLAKVTRDRIMRAQHETWPMYEFARHKGYITPEHEAALHQHGPSPIHRRRYVNVRRAMGLPALGRSDIDGVEPGTVEDAAIVGDNGYVAPDSNLEATA
jgi:ribonuclease HII